MKSESDNVGFFEMRIRPSFIGWLLGVVALIAILAGAFPQHSRAQDKAKAVATLAEMKAIAIACTQTNDGYAVLPLGSNGLLQVALLGGAVKTSLSNYLDRTNSHGELLDMWRMPLRFEPAGKTNLVIRSAGLNRRFGDKNDLVFNCASNSLVKP